MRTVKSASIKGARLWLTTGLLYGLLVAACGAKYHRRSMPTQQTLPVSKGGWRPVVGSGGLVYGGSYNAPLHAPTYKFPVSVLDSYQSSARPLVARDTGKLTSIAQSYRPTTLRTVPAPSAPNANQPINSYHNPFAFNNNLAYKFVQNFPSENVVIRNPQSPYSARPVYTKYPNKLKQSLQSNVFQQLSNVQPIQFGQYQQTSKPLDIFGKPVEGYVRPTDSKPAQSSMEIFKPEVYKLPDSATASQSGTQTVKTAQQQQLQQQYQFQQQKQGHQQQQQQLQHQFHQQSFLGGTPKTPPNPYSHYTYQDSLFPSGILGTFGSFGLQPVKARDPVFQHNKNTYFTQYPTKQTVFNSYSFTPTFKTTPTIFVPSTTPKFQTTANQIQLTSTFNDYKNIKNIPTQTTKIPPSIKTDPSANKFSFKASPQDPFVKQYLSEYNKLAVTTYNPLQVTTSGNNFFEYNYNPGHQSAQLSNYFDQPSQTLNYQKKKQKIHDSIAAGVNQADKQYVSPPKSRPTYEVTEASETDTGTHPSTHAWTQQSYDSNPKTTEESVTKQQSPETSVTKHTTTLVPDSPEEYAIVTEADKGYENSLSYDGQVESQSRRPLGDDFEPIGKHKLKDYYYKVSTPAYEDYIASKRTKKPTESSRLTTQSELTTSSVHKETTNDIITEALPTLPPNQHFKRPTTPEPLDKDRIRKRNKNRRRRPPLGNGNQNKEEISTTRKYSTTEQPQTTDTDEVHTLRPRIRPTKGKPNLTTPSVTTDLTTSAVPTISPTAPTIIKKKLIRRPLTEKIETTTLSLKDYDNNKESPIMKIATRPQYTKYNSNYETPDYSHKQDEKDTPTSDIAVSLSDSLKTTPDSQTFAFHKDVKPIEAKLEIRETTTDSDKVSNDITEATTATPSETTPSKIQRPRLKNKYNRPRFSVKDYRNRLSSTTSTTEKSAEPSPKLRFPHRKFTLSDIETETTTERRKFMPKDPRHKNSNGSEFSEDTEKEIHSLRHRQKLTTSENTDSTTQKISSRIRNGSRKPKPTEEVSDTTTVHSKRPLRKKIKDSEIGESVQDVSVTETTVHYDIKHDITSERTRSESAIMKIADKKHHQDPIEHLFEHSKRVSDLTLAASKDYNTPGMFKTVSSNSRRIPNYFTIATDDPILPIEAFFPQLNQKKEA